jgi:hypothetical protein
LFVPYSSPSSAVLVPLMAFSCCIELQSATSTAGSSDSSSPSCSETRLCSSLALSP